MARGLNQHGDNLSALNGQQGVAILSHNIHKAQPLTSELMSYPERSPLRVESILAAYKGVEKQSIIAMPGATAAFYMLASAFRRKVEVLIYTPTYTGYCEAFTAYGHKVRTCVLDVDYAVVNQSIPDSVDVVIVGNPNNPTGSYANMRAWIEAHPQVLFIIDESFIQFTDEVFSLRQAAGEMDHVLVVESMTKFYGMAGVRLGVIYGHKRQIEKLRRFQVPWSVTVTPEFLEKRLAESDALLRVYLEEKAFVLKGLDALGIEYIEGAANFYLLKVKDASAVYDGLLAYGILTRCLNDFEGLEANVLRVAVGTHFENRAFLRALKALKDKKGEIL